MVTCGDYLGKELPEDKCDLIRERIVEKVLGAEVSDFAPRFKDSFPRKGTMIFVCADEQTKTWLEGCAGDIEIGPGDNLRVVQQEDLPKIHKVGVFLPNGVKDADSLLKAIRVQNKDIDASGWIVLHRGDVKVGAKTPQHVILGVDDASLEALKVKKFRLFAGVGELTLRLLDRKQAEKKGQGG